VAVLADTGLVIGFAGMKEYLTIGGEDYVFTLDRLFEFVIFCC